MTYRFLCDPDRGGCSTVFRLIRSVDEREKPAVCPSCKSAKSTIRVYTPPRVNHDLDYQDGRLGDSHLQPAFGPGYRVRTRQELREAQLRAREQMWAKTYGRHEYMVPDPDNPGHKEKVTVDHPGIDVGEIHTSDGEFTIPDHEAMARREFEESTKDFRRNYVEEPYTG